MTTRTKRWGGWAVLCAAVLVCALGGWSYAQARGDDTLSYAKSRDAALADGTRHLARLNSMDGGSEESVESGLTAWLAASTGPLRDRLEDSRTKDTAALTASGTTARGKVTDAALTALDERAGTAALIATVDVEVTPRTGEGGTERKRFEASLARTGDGWKVTALDALPVGSGT
ncbi:hypothetical protein OG909_29285 [Streptomyces sp. NBC_01754]|uniref:hypothetical protein n=1 Tax=Streptomyces sp. NBC_01754 TaxID=2975930 RepID=UPI002DD848BE|nr:hypothetical protein [Streptomyces sp. NBC_01754]WSC96057.1 hypothetical protein OG909_29285 [Streptomyces sp. NBC_01754]